jgi:hypothetical protein
MNAFLLDAAGLLGSTGLLAARTTKPAGSGLPSLWIVVAAALVLGAGAWLTWMFWEQIRRKNPSVQSVSRSLFLDLCRKHALSDAEVSFAERLARSGNLDQPALVFVDPRHLRAAAREGADTRPQALELGQKLFGSLAQW